MSKVVCFDIGGVLVRICHTWQEAALVAGVQTSLADLPLTPLSTAPCFDRYQSSDVSLEDYLSELGEFLGVSKAEALRVHDGILVDPYPGIPELTDELKTLGWRTGCLSNTNAPHWVEFTEREHFACVGSLDMKMPSHEVGISKPDPRIFETYAATFGLEPADIQYFDDHAPNVESARLCGWNAHWIDNTGDTAAQIRRRLFKSLWPSA